MFRNYLANERFSGRLLKFFIVYKKGVLRSKGSFKHYVTSEGGKEGSKRFYEPLQKLGEEKGGFSNAITLRSKNLLYDQFHEKLTYRKLFFVLFNLKNPGIQVKIILATG